MKFVRKNEMKPRTSNGRISIAIFIIASLCSSSDAFSSSKSQFQCLIARNQYLLFSPYTSYRHRLNSVEDSANVGLEDTDITKVSKSTTKLTRIRASTSMKGSRRQTKNVPEDKVTDTERKPASNSKSINSRRRQSIENKGDGQNPRKKRKTTGEKEQRNSPVLNQSQYTLPVANVAQNREKRLKKAPPKFRGPSSQSVFQRFEMTQHDILSKEVEFELGAKISKAKKMRDLMQAVIDQKELENYDMYYSNSFYENNFNNNNDEWEENASIYDSTILNNSENTEVDFLMAEMLDSSSPDEFSNIMAIDEFGLSILRKSSRQLSKNTLVQEASKLSLLKIKSDINILSEEDIIEKLELPGGKKELTKLLLEGSKARDYLMRCNIRLVVNISKKWMNRNYAAFNSDGAKLSDLYNGGWDRPTLDEVTQEGVIGLARAVDKYDFKKGLRFSTYATHWITSYVRQCFQRASTGCLYVPSQLHDIKSQYKNVVKRYINTSEKIPAEADIAKELGVTVNRLRTAIRVTESLISIDQPVYNGNAAFKGSGAGGDFNNELILADTLQCAEVAPEDHIEISFLRQSLENAMAAELSPHERDVLRLRLGLDDGKTRTIREVVDVCGGGISTSDVRSAERRAFKKLSSPNAIHAHNLLSYLDMVGIDLDSYQNKS